MNEKLGQFWRFCVKLVQMLWNIVLFFLFHFTTKVTVLVHILQTFVSKIICE